MRADSTTPDPPTAPDPRGPTAAAPGADVPFGVNEVRLGPRQWLAACALVALVVLLAPRLWETVERFDTAPDYRVPYALSKDYWLYERRLRQDAHADSVVLLGDSVVWGEYVNPDGTLSHFLNQETGARTRFINAGVNGLFPLALEGLVQHYARPVLQRHVVVHCNMLWMTSPKADLSAPKEEPFNHANLVAQFWPRIPCYKADAHTRLNAAIERSVGFLGWINHLQCAYFDQKSIPLWTLADDGAEPPRRPNAWANPLAQLRRAVPTAPAHDPDRGPDSARHKAWSSDGTPTARFDWVPLDRSLQWAAFQRLVRTLQRRGNHVLVILGPFNETMLVEENRATYRQLRDGIGHWLTAQGIQHVVPEPLPSALYADASHPLTEGYRLLARRLLADPAFRKWNSP
jgi:hypothetical protein